MMPKLPVTMLLLASLSLLCGCSALVKGTLTVLPFTQRDKPRDPVELQSQLIRFADHYLEAVTRNMQYIHYNGKQITPQELVRRRINYTNEVLAIATGSNAFANLVDMVVLVSLTRMRIENYLGPQAKGLDLGPILKVFRESEREIWRISSMALTSEHQEELRVTLARWMEQNPKLRMTPDMSDLDFIAELKEFSRARTSSAPTSVLNLLMIDPLSGLDPAAKELAETRLMAERALFLSRHLPELIRWEAEYLTMNTIDVPEIAKLLADTSKLSESADRFSQVSQQLPELINSQREHLVATLKSERQGLTTLASESRSALMAGKQMADSANATLQSFQAILAQLQANPSNPNAEPFRIGDYTAAAAQISKTSERLAELLNLLIQTTGPENVEALSNRVELLSRQVEARSNDVVDYAYRKALIGSALIGAMALCFALAYRFLSLWLSHVARRRWSMTGGSPKD